MSTDEQHQESEEQEADQLPLTTEKHKGKEIFANIARSAQNMVGMPREALKALKEGKEARKAAEAYQSEAEKIIADTRAQISTSRVPDISQGSDAVIVRWYSQRENPGANDALYEEQYTLPQSGRFAIDTPHRIRTITLEELQRTGVLTHVKLSHTSGNGDATRNVNVSFTNSILEKGKEPVWNVSGWGQDQKGNSPGPWSLHDEHANSLDEVKALITEMIPPRSNYHDMFLQLYKERFPEDEAGETLLDEIITNITEQALANKKLFPHNGNVVPYSTIDVNAVWAHIKSLHPQHHDNQKQTDATPADHPDENDLQPKKEEENETKQVHIFDLGGFGSSVAANLDSGIRDVLSELLKVKNTPGRKVKVHIIGNTFGREGTVTRELLAEMAGGLKNQDAIRPLAKINAALATEIITTDGSNADQTHVVIRGQSAGGNIGVVMADEMGAIYDNPKSSRLGRLPLANTTIQATVYNPANLNSDKAFNLNVIFNAIKERKKAHKKTYFTSSDPTREIFDKQMHPNEDDDEQKTLKKYAKGLVGGVLARGTPNTTIPVFRKEGAENTVGTTAKKRRERDRVRERAALQREENRDRAELNKLAVSMGYDQVGIDERKRQLTREEAQDREALNKLAGWMGYEQVGKDEMPLYKDPKKDFTAYLDRDGDHLSTDIHPERLNKLLHSLLGDNRKETLAGTSAG